MKTTTINLRISVDLKDQLDELASEKNISTSEITRSILENYFYDLNSYEEEQFQDEDLEEEIQINNNESFEEEESLINSVEFLKLIAWIFYHNSNEYIFLEKKDYQQFMDTILHINLHKKKFDEKLIKEFYKIFRDLTLAEENGFLTTTKLDFANTYSHKRFDFKMLMKFIMEQSPNSLKITI